MDLSGLEVGAVELDGVTVANVNLTGAPSVDWSVTFRGRLYRFDSSVLVNGYGAVLPERLQELTAAGKRALLITRGERYYLFVSEADGAS